MSVQTAPDDIALSERQPLNVTSPAAAAAASAACDVISDVKYEPTNSDCVTMSPKKSNGGLMQRCCDRPAKICEEICHLCKKVNCKKHARQLFTVNTLKQRLPILKWIPKYRFHHFQGDLIAGITVGLTVIPQSLAYAKIAELPPQYGLYSAFMGCFVYVLLGTSKDVNFGPTAVMSLLTAEFGHSMLKDDATYAIALALICGVIQIIMGLLHLGFLVEYISHPVINSFTIAAAITIASSQVKKWLGLRGVPRGFSNEVYWTLRKLPETKPWDFSLGFVCMLLLYLLKRMKDMKCITGGERTTVRAIVIKVVWVLSTARNAIVVILAAVLAGILYTQDHIPFSLTGNITSGIPQFKPPAFSISSDNHTYTAVDAFRTMGVGIALVPVVGVIEVIAIAKAFGRKNGYSVDANQEFYACGIANVLGSFFSAYPVTASFSRSAVNAQSGSMTTLGGIFTGALVLLALAFLTPLFYYIPDAALAAVIIMAVLDMIEFSMVRHLWAINKPDLLPWFTTFIISLSAGFEYGIILGVVVSLMILLFPWARPRIKISPYETEGLISSEQVFKDIVVVRISMGLMFPGVEHLQDKVMDKAFKDGRCNNIIMDFLKVSKVDYTAAVGIKQLSEDVTKHKASMVFVNVKPSVLKVFGRAHVEIKHASTLIEAAQLIKSLNTPEDAISLKVVPEPTECTNVEAAASLTRKPSLNGKVVCEVSINGSSVTPAVAAVGPDEIVVKSSRSDGHL